MKKIKGIGASSGIAIAKAYHLETQNLSYDKKTVDTSEEQIKRLTHPLPVSKSELEKIRDHTEREMATEYAEIFSAHLLVLEDPELINPIKEKITNEQLNAEAALDN